MEQLDEGIAHFDKENEEKLTVRVKNIFITLSGWLITIGIVLLFICLICFISGIMMLQSNPLIGALFLIWSGIGCYISTIFFSLHKSSKKSTFNIEKFSRSFSILIKTSTIFLLLFILVVLISIFFVLSVSQIP